MQFAEPDKLNWLWLAPGLVALLIAIMARRRKVLGAFVEQQLLEKIASNLSIKRMYYKNILLIFVFIFSVIALARPQWGFEWQEVKRQGIDILLVVDTSRSMLTQDIKPSRLERAKLAIQDFLKKLQGDRIGLIAFAGDAFLACPLTVDYSGFLLSLNDLSTETIARGGTNLAGAIREAMQSYSHVANKYKAIIVITDGEELEGDALALAQKARERGIKIYCVGVGTKEGELIKAGDEFIKDTQGNYVKSRLNEGLLEQIAAATGGTYVRASGVRFGLDLIYDQELSKLEKREMDSKMEKKYFERFQIPLAIALILLIAETCLCTRVDQKTA